MNEQVEELRTGLEGLRALHRHDTARLEGESKSLDGRLQRMAETLEKSSGTLQSALDTLERKCRTFATKPEFKRVEGRLENFV